MKNASLKIIWYNYYKPWSGTTDGKSLIYWLTACLCVKEILMLWLIITQIYQKKKESENAKNEIKNFSYFWRSALLPISMAVLTRKEFPEGKFHVSDILWSI